MHRLAGRAIPQHGGLALVGDADRGKVARRQVRAAQRVGNHRACVVQDFQRIVFDPARLRVDLPVLALRLAIVSPARSNTMKRLLVVP